MANDDNGTRRARRWPNFLNVSGWGAIVAALLVIVIFIASVVVNVWDFSGLLQYASSWKASKPVEVSRTSEMAQCDERFGTDFLLDVHKLVLFEIYLSAEAQRPIAGRLRDSVVHSGAVHVGAIKNPDRAFVYPKTGVKVRYFDQADYKNSCFVGRLATNIGIHDAAPELAPGLRRASGKVEVWFSKDWHNP